MLQAGAATGGQTAGASNTGAASGGTVVPGPSQYAPATGGNPAAATAAQSIGSGVASTLSTLHPGEAALPYTNMSCKLNCRPVVAFTCYAVVEIITGMHGIEVSNFSGADRCAKHPCREHPCHSHPGRSNSCAGCSYHSRLPATS